MQELTLSRNYIIKTTTKTDDDYSGTRVKICFPNEGKYKNPPSEICKGTRIILCDKDTGVIMYLGEFDHMNRKTVSGDEPHQFEVINKSPSFSKIWKKLQVDYRPIIKKFNSDKGTRINTRKLTSGKHIEVSERFYEYVLDEIEDAWKRVNGN